jgi:hypothetical protein
VLLLVGVDGMAALEDRRSFFEKAVEVWGEEEILVVVAVFGVVVKKNAVSGGTLASGLPLWRIFGVFFNYLTNDIFLKKKNLIFDVFRITLDIFCFFFDFFIRI